MTSDDVIRQWGTITCLTFALRPRKEASLDQVSLLSPFLNVRPRYNCRHFSLRNGRLAILLCYLVAADITLSSYLQELLCSDARILLLIEFDKPHGKAQCILPINRQSWQIFLPLFFGLSGRLLALLAHMAALAPKTPIPLSSLWKTSVPLLGF